MFLFNDNFLPPPQDVVADVFRHFNLDFNIMLLFTYFSNACRDDKLLELMFLDVFREWSQFVR